MTTNPTFGTGRYQLHDLLGSGAMGRVYRAYDRLRNQAVALKWVTVVPENLAFTSRPSDVDREGLLLALTHEFRTLASLRHPHIISVLDYGFDSTRQPFFTMDLLEDAQTVLEAGRVLPLQQQAEFLIQILEALAYLHRRGILHHDLKPANVLVSHSSVRLLDFGLSVVTNQQRSDDIFGTLQYLAPEILDAQPYTPAADLYSLGVIAYELLIGHYPFPATTVGQYIDQAFNMAVDLSSLDNQPALATWLAQLLAKSPAQRPASAQDAIISLRQALGEQPSADRAAIRESYLQAATFVGRTAELAHLILMLEQAGQGLGSSWLIAGESGVGKSRLLEELRVHALVDGFQVLQGQAVEGAGLLYQIWREPIRRLALHTQMSDLEASVLIDLVPDIELLLGRKVENAAALGGDIGRQRLLSTIVTMLRRQTMPLLLLLEDLHWSSESLDVLNEVNRAVAGLPLLVVGSYRDEERPGLPAELPDMQVLKLERLNATGIAELSASMLGDNGRIPGVLALLQRETEGNSFFMVEVVRALAEEAGSLAQVGQTTIPAHIFAGGVQRVLWRRLERVPERLRDILNLAAIAGRELDLAALAHLSGQRLNDWLVICAEAAVIETYDDHWRFAHDKLREAVLAELDAHELPRLHGQVAQALEAVYPQQDQLAETLMEHWRVAANPTRELHYMLMVVARWIEYGLNYRGACALLERGLQLAGFVQDTDWQRMQLYTWLGKAYEWLSDFPAADTAYEHSRVLAEQFGDRAGLAAALRGTGRTAWRQGYAALALERCEQAFQLYHELHDEQGMAECLADSGIINIERHHFMQGDSYLLQALDRFRALNESKGIYSCQNDLGISAALQGNSAKARNYFMQALHLAREINHRTGMALSLLNLGTHAFETENFEAARRYLSESRDVSHEIDDRGTLGFTLQMLGLTAMEEGDYSGAHSSLNQALEIFQAIHTIPQVATALSDLGLLATRQQDYALAAHYYEQSLALFNEPDDLYRSNVVHLRAQLHLACQNREAALADLREALSLAHQHQVMPEILQTLLGWALLCLGDARAECAAELLGLVEGQSALTGIARRRFLRPVLAQLESLVRPEQLHTARQRGASLELDMVVQELIQRFE